MANPDDSQSPALKAALFYAAKGWSVVPVHTASKVNGKIVCSCSKGEHCTSPGKHPAVSWSRYQKERASDIEIRAWFSGPFRANGVGIITGQVSGIFVVDVDCGPGKQGADTLNILQLNNDDLPETCEAITGSGGRHYLFKAPDGVRIITDKAVLGPDVDVRGEGGFIVASPSFHACGNRYRWKTENHPQTMEVSLAPDWVIQAAREDHWHKRQHDGITSAPGVIIRHPVTGKVMDGRESHMCKIIMASLISYCGENGCFPDSDELFDEAWPTYFSTTDFSREGRGADEFRHKCVTTLRRGEAGAIHEFPDLEAFVARAHAKKNAEAEKGQAKAEAKAEASKAPDGFNIRDWTADKYELGKAPAQEWLCEGTIPLGKPVLLAAMGGLGKSYLAIDMGLGIASGVIANSVVPRTALGGEIVAHGSVVILSAEDSKDSIHRRLDKIDPSNGRLSAGHKLMIVPMPDAGGPRPLITGGRDGFAKTEFFAELKRQLMEVEDLRLVVIDPLQAFVTADITADVAASQFMWTAFAEICAATGATIMATHHMRKDGMTTVKTADDARECIKGNTGIVDGARLAYALWKVGEEEAIGVCAQIGEEYRNGKVVRGAVVKVNDEADMDIHTYIRSPSGLLVERDDIDMDAVKAPSVTFSQVEEIQKEIQKAWSDENPYGLASQHARPLYRLIMDMTSLREKAAKSFVKDWSARGVVVEDMVSTHSKKKGLYIGVWIRNEERKSA